MLIREKAEVKFEIIREMTARDNNLLNISLLCKIAYVSRSGYYRWLGAEDVRKAREGQDEQDFGLMLEAYRFRGYEKGARGIYMRLLHQIPPIVMNIKKIRRLMHKYGLMCPIRKANPYRRMAKALKTSNVAPNLLNREFREHGPRMVLLTDITYIHFGAGVRCYMSTILDAFTKQLLAYVVSESLEVDFVLETVEILIQEHGISLQAETLINSDQGCHYTSYRFIQIIRDANLRQSMSRRANCWDNAPQESFYGHMKDEIDLAHCQTFGEVKVVIADWTDYYNNDRYQWQLAKLSPNEFYEYVHSGIHPLDGLHGRTIEPGSGKTMEPSSGGSAPCTPEV
ncbi:MAG: IS3 family transposase [Candidatus Limiplasma sp.]|nr:IS3 family transposase [Candidatus Limiplasma sp.]